jgi:ParB family chromosome partitioning protein
VKQLLIDKRKEIEMAEKNAKLKEKKGLGKGLAAFFQDVELDSVPPKTENSAEKEEKNGVLLLKIRDIEPNPEQPRKTFDKEKLEDLASSIKEHGLIQPVLVKPADNGMYIIIAGERRWRASKLAGLKEIPCIIGEYSEKEVMELALIENLQREDLNPIEESEGYQKLMDAFSLTQEEVAERVGKSRSAIANSLRLSGLSKEIKKMVAEGVISQGHARCLLALEKEADKISVAERIKKEGLSVRQTENLVSMMQKHKKSKPKTVDKNVEAYFKKLADELSFKLETKVSIKHGKKRGKIEIEYYNNSDLENILNKIQ